MTKSMTFTSEILDRKFHFLYNVHSKSWVITLSANFLPSPYHISSSAILRDEFDRYGEPDRTQFKI